MKGIHKLPDDKVNEMVKNLKGWQLINSKLHKDFQFADFSEAFSFMGRIALEVHLMNHHPEWSNVYNKVSIDLTTHDVGGISNLDIELAQKIDSFLG